MLIGYWRRLVGYDVCSGILLTLSSRSMDLSALESSIKTLESSLDSWATWLFVATFLVVVGLILEYWYEIRDLLASRPFERKHSLTILGAILGTIGVAGELVIEYQASRVETALRRANGKVIPY
jgi:hypothetical protein